MDPVNIFFMRKHGQRLTLGLVALNILNNDHLQSTSTMHQSRVKSVIQLHTQSPPYCSSWPKTLFAVLAVAVFSVVALSVVVLFCSCDGFNFRPLIKKLVNNPTPDQHAYIVHIVLKPCANASFTNCACLGSSSRTASTLVKALSQLNLSGNPACKLLYIKFSKFIVPVASAMAVHTFLASPYSTAASSISMYSRFACIATKGGCAVSPIPSPIITENAIEMYK